MKFCPPCHRIPKKVLRFIGVLFVCFGILTAYMLQNYHSDLTKERQNKIRKHVENAHHLIVYYHHKFEINELSEDRAKRYALESIKQLTPDKSGYYWVMDTHPRMLMHPITPDMDGKDLTDYVGPDGQKLFLEMVAVTRADGAGFIHYLWAKPDTKDNKLYPKVSFIKMFAPWNWIVGSGVYVDDIETSFWNAVYVACGLSIAILMFVLALAMTVFESLKKP